MIQLKGLVGFSLPFVDVGRDCPEADGLPNEVIGGSGVGDGLVPLAPFRSAQGGLFISMSSTLTKYSRLHRG